MNKVLTIAILSAFGFVFLGSATAQAANKGNNRYDNDRHSEHKDRHHDNKKDKDYGHDRDRDHDKDCDDGYVSPPKNTIHPIPSPPTYPRPILTGGIPVPKFPIKNTIHPIVAGKPVTTVHPVHGRPGQIPNIGTGWDGFAGAVGGEVGSIVTGTLKGVGAVAGGAAKGVGDVLGGVAQGVGDVASGVASGIGDVLGGIF